MADSKNINVGCSWIFPYESKTARTSSFEATPDKKQPKSQNFMFNYLMKEHLSSTIHVTPIWLLSYYIHGYGSILLDLQKNTYQTSTPWKLDKWIPRHLEYHFATFHRGKFITMTMESWKWKMAVSERELLLEIHPSFTEQNDYGRERVPVVYSISHFFTKHPKKNTLKKKTKKNEFVSRCPMILAVSRCPGGIGIPFLFAIFCQKNTADRGT